jgi:hypothetical protein
MPQGFNPDRSDVVESASASGACLVGVTATEIKVGAARLQDRQKLKIYNPGPKTVYISSSPSVTTASTPLYKGSQFVGPIGDIAFYGIVDSGTQSVTVEEIG